ncbi:MAG: HAD hydrolase-like protein [Candidatus Scatovivens sp.]
MNIGIDIDDTISSTFEETYPRAKEYLKNVLGREVIEDYSKAIDFNYIENILKITPEEMEGFWRANLADLLKKVKPKQSAIETINRLKQEGHKIIIITARWNKDYCDSEEISKEWLKKYNISYDKIYTGAESKKEIAINEKLDLFIDDSIKNCREISNSNIKCFLFASKVNIYNKECENFEIVNSWDEIYKKINKEEL